MFADVESRDTCVQGLRERDDRIVRRRRVSMKLIAIMPVKNESWILGLSARVALQWCDMLIVADHHSTDKSRDIMNDLHREYGASRFLIRDDRVEDWHEMQQRNMLLEEARDQGATHIAMIDADEILTGNLQRTIREHVESLGVGQMLYLPGYNLRGGLDRYHSNGVWGNRWFSTAFKDSLRLDWRGDKFHHREPEGLTFTPRKPIEQGDGGVMHLWAASERRLIAKHALYKVTERLRFPQKPVAEIDRMYSWAIHGDPSNPKYGTPRTWTYAPVKDSWWFGYKEWMKYLDLDAVPWQEQAVRDLVAEHGRERFAQLDLFGIA